MRVSEGYQPAELQLLALTFGTPTIEENLYNKYHSSRDNERLGLFVALDKKYSIRRVLYPGSFVHITPSFVFQNVVYVDSMESARSFFTKPSTLELISERKQYSDEPEITFHKMDYRKKFAQKEKSFDLLVSQYAGFVSQACKKYLKVGGILVANNSHGDASMASMDSDFALVGVYNRRSDRKYSISDKDLQNYLIPKSGKMPTKELLEKTQRGIGYTKSPSGYIFKRRK